MKYSVKTKNKVLKKILSSEYDTSTYLIKDIPTFEKSCSFITQAELTHYLHILSFEHLIDAECEDDKITSIQILPDAFSRYATTKSENIYKNITLYFAIISTFCALIQTINLFWQVLK